MKILDNSQSGRRGLAVSQGGRCGRMSRTCAVAANPRTRAQTGARRAFAQPCRLFVLLGLVGRFVCGFLVFLERGLQFGLHALILAAGDGFLLDLERLRDLA
jgi:hypothetical protein